MSKAVDAPSQMGKQASGYDALLLQSRHASVVSVILPGVSQLTLAGLNIRGKAAVKEGVLTRSTRFSFGTISSIRHCISLRLPISRCIPRHRDIDRADHHAQDHWATIYQVYSSATDLQRRCRNILKTLSLSAEGLSVYLQPITSPDTHLSHLPPGSPSLKGQR